ncbi:hypothetical protein AMATHDRAFT_3627 [Amanita thiersii Skay4041]|uniref:Uncharacterized protein n=1 Tax=Amanita thiersii Skay4041 TaxID=703135 RepID=A0A2A9NR21_9AGAR|nr:hypothetical protein AMATHDRAFT_3627 [Amanita thiersii Skay4041]
MSALAERNLGRPWTDEEDRLLTDAVKIHGERDRWKTIALSVPGRTNKACRKRWLHSLSPTVKKTAWTPDEDHQLLRLYEQLGPKWSAIAREIPGRTDDACSKRYREALDPSLRKDEWTPEEDTKLMEVYSRIGGKWGQVGQELQRSGLGCRNRWRLLERKRAHKTTQGNSTLQIPQSQISYFEPSPCEDIQGLLLLPGTDDTTCSQASWSSFFTPEQYPLHIEDTYQFSEEFCLPSPQSEVQNAPFQFSSSSLSAALFNPPVFNSPAPPSISSLTEDRCEDPSSSSSVSPASPHTDLTVHVEGQQVSRNDLSSFRDSLDLGRILAQVGFNSPAIHSNQDLDMGNVIAVSPLFSPQDMSQPNLLPPQESLTRSPSTPSELFGLSPGEQYYPIGFSYDDSTYEELSSTTSTPFNFASSLSPTSSPYPLSPVELPMGDPNTAGSLLFAPDSSSRPAKAPDNSKRPRKLVSRRTVKPPGTTRLSTNLAITSDPTIKPYACGNERCWPTDSPRSSSCYATSRELFDHYRNEHESDPPADKPFRCALAGCHKSWKARSPFITLNGIQYHLQISTAHFRHALSTSFSAQQLHRKGVQGSSTGDSNTDDVGDDESSGRVYTCTHPKCFKAYKQPSGLRYHLKHGHPHRMPAQLPVVPPVLARRLPANVRKMRRKASAEPET